jgi:glycosyltransferase involved in cell wall biosynthesis
MKYLKKYGHNTFLCTNGGDSFDRINDFNIPLFISKSFSNRFSFLRSVNMLAGIIAENNIDIIHSHHRYYELIAVAAAGLSKRKVQTVFTALSFVDRRYAIEFKSKEIIAVSMSVSDMLVNKFKLNRNKIKVIPNFADSEEIIKTENFEAKKHSLNILCVGRLHKEKDQMTLLKAVALLKNKNIKLTLIGEGNEYEACNNFIINNSINAKILSPRRELNNFFNNADICVLPSVRDPFPGFMLQSGLHKKPFIGSNTDGIAELIIQRENGLLFRKKDAEDLAEKIKIFAENKSLADKCRMNLFETVSNNYTEKQIIPEIIKLYKDLIR